MTEYPSTRIKPIKEVHLPDVDKAVTQNGIPVYIIAGGTEPVLHLELIFSAGKVNEKQRGAAHATAALITDGTSLRSSQEIARMIEHYGSTLRATAGTDGISISLYCMTRFLDEGLEILVDVINSAVFPEKELALYKQKRRHDLKISMGQNEYIANRLLSRALFGDHAYGDATTEDHVSALQREHIAHHYQTLGANNASAFICGKVDRTHIKSIFLALEQTKAGRPAPNPEPPTDQPMKTVDVRGPQKHQCAIRLGQKIPHRHDEDFAPLFLLNTLAGGYFGSRLMKNIREDKGLTYNIFSSIETLVMGAYCVISTEANAARADQVLGEIENELNTLCTELVSDHEIQMTKNYLMGNLMMNLDGPFRSMEVIKTMVMEGLAFGTFEVFNRGIREADSHQLREIARKYLDFTNMHKVVVRG